MPHRLPRVYLIPRLLRSLLGKRVTVLYPYGTLEIDESYRGEISIDIDRCIGCGACARACPTNALEVERLEGGGVSIRHDYGRCANCGQCELSCPRGAIRLRPSFHRAVTSLDQLHREWRRDGPPQREDKD